MEVITETTPAAVRDKIADWLEWRAKKLGPSIPGNTLSNIAADLRAIPVMLEVLGEPRPTGPRATLRQVAKNPARRLRVTIEMDIADFPGTLPVIKERIRDHVEGFRPGFVPVFLSVEDLGKDEYPSFGDTPELRRHARARRCIARRVAEASPGISFSVTTSVTPSI